MQYAEAGANACGDGFVDLLNLGFVLFHTAGDAEVAQPTFNNPAFGATAAGVATMETGSAVEDTTTTAGTVAHAHILKSDDTQMGHATCGVGSGEFQFSSLAFGNNETLRIVAMTITWTVTAMT